MQSPKTTHLTKKKIIFLILLSIAAIFIVYLIILFSRQPHERALGAIGADNIRRQKNYSWDGVNTHGGISMDGQSYYRFLLSKKDQMETVLQKDGWHPLPVDERIFNEVDGILGSMAFGGNISETDRDEILAALGQISEGAWFFQDKNDIESLKNMDLDWTFHHDRRLTDYIIAVYDANAGVIYYFDSNL